MSQNVDREPFRTRVRNGVSNFLQKYRTVLLGLVGAAILITGGLALWTQIDSATKSGFAARIEKSQADYLSWMSEADASKKATAGEALEKELAQIEKDAPTGYGLSKAWFINGNYFASQKKWVDAVKAFKTVFEKDPKSYLAPIALVNAGVCQEEALDVAGALATYSDFERNYSADSLLAPQVFFTEGRLLETQQKAAAAVAAYKKLVEKFPESGWTKLGRDRILFLNLD